MCKQLSRDASYSNCLEYYPPPDKSITIRAILLAAFSNGKSIIKNYLRCEDSQAAINCVKALGASVCESEGFLEITEVQLEGKKRMSAKDFLLGNFRIGMENQRARMFFFGNAVQTYGRVIAPETILDAVEAVTADDVLAVANEILREDMMSVSWVTPKSK